jgi:hypothetical protein
MPGGPGTILASGRVGNAAKGAIMRYTVGRKPRRNCSFGLSCRFPHAPGLSHSLRAGNYNFGLSLDKGHTLRGYWRPTAV